MRTHLVRLIPPRSGTLDIRRPFPDRKLRVISHASFANQSTRNSQTPRKTSLREINLTNYGVGLEQRINAIFQEQHSWYSGIEREARDRQAENENIIQEAQSDWSYQVEAKRKERDKIERTQREARERQRLKEERLRRLEQERIQRRGSATYTKTKITGVYCLLG